MFKTWCDLRVYARREWVVLTDFEWDDGAMRVVVPRGFITDLASIPRGLRNLFDINGPSREAAVLHDWLYCAQEDAADQPVTRRQADDLFRTALAACGMGSITRNFYWTGVRAGGWMYWDEREDRALDPEDFVPDEYWTTKR